MKLRLSPYETVKPRLFAVVRTVTVVRSPLSVAVVVKVFLPLASIDLVPKIPSKFVADGRRSA